MGISVGRKLKRSLPDLLRERKEAFLNEWHDRILSGCESKTAVLLRKEPDRFANPVGHAYREAIEAIYRILIGEDDVALGAVDYALKIRAVQERDPERAIEFIYPIKDLVREQLGEIAPAEDVKALESRVDHMAAIAMEMFAEHRKMIADLGRRGLVSVLPRSRHGHSITNI